MTKWFRRTCAAVAAVLVVATVQIGMAPTAGADGVPPSLIQKISGGNAAPSYTGETALSARSEARDLTMDQDGNLLWVDIDYQQVQVLARSQSDPGYSVGNWAPGNVYAIAGAQGDINQPGVIGAPSSEVDISQLGGVALDNDNNVLLSTSNGLLVYAVGASVPSYVSPSVQWHQGWVYQVSGAQNSNATLTYDGSDLNDTPLVVRDVTVDANGNIVMTTANRIVVVAVGQSDPGYLLWDPQVPRTWTIGNVYVIAGGGQAAPGAIGSAAELVDIAPGPVAVDQYFNVVWGDSNGSGSLDVLSVSGDDPGYLDPNAGWKSQSVYLLAGGVSNGNQSTWAGSDPLQTETRPSGVAFDSSGNVLLTDADADRVDLYSVSPTASGYVSQAHPWSQRSLYWIAGIDGEAVSVDTTPGNVMDWATFHPQSLAVSKTGEMVVAEQAQIDSIVSVPDAPPDVQLHEPSSPPGVNVSFTPPDNTGGLPILGYSVVAEPGDIVVGTGQSSPINVSTVNLTPGVQYTFWARASNEVGDGALGGPTQPFSIGPVSTAPGVPLNVDSIRGNQQVQVRWYAPASDGGSVITAYKVEYSVNGGQNYVLASDAITPAAPNAQNAYVVPNLTNGQAYTFRVSAINVIGTGTGATTVGTPLTGASAPQSLVATPGNGQVSLAWQPPQSTGGSSVGGYKVEYSTDGDVWQTAYGSTTSPAIVSSLTNGTPYQFRVSAVTTFGLGLPVVSGATPVSPTSAPTAPTALTVTPSTSQAAVSWAAPQSDGGSLVSAYHLEYRAVGAQNWTLVSDDATSPASITGLLPNTQYEVRLAAVNEAGTGAHATATFTTLALMPSPGITAPVHITPTGEVVKVPVYTPPVPPAVPPIIAATPSGGGSWTLAPDGGVFTAGDAPFLGSMGGTPLNAPMTGISSTPSGTGYYLVGSDGGVFTYGDANFQGSMGGQQLNAPVTAIAPSCTNNGYYLVANDGGVFAYGDAQFHGSMADIPLNAGMLGIVPACDNSGYWTYAKDGGVFTFGGAKFYGSLGSNPPPGGVVGMVSAPDGKGYWLIGADGTTYPFGSAAS